MGELLIQNKLQEFGPLAKSSPSEDSWLVAELDHEQLVVKFGCRLCMRLVREGQLRLPLRYRDATKSTSFVHGNVHKDIKRGIGFHLDSKTHKLALSLAYHGGYPMEDTRKEEVISGPTLLAGM